MVFVADQDVRRLVDEAEFVLVAAGDVEFFDYVGNRREVDVFLVKQKYLRFCKQLEVIVEMLFCVGQQFVPEDLRPLRLDYAPESRVFDFGQDPETVFRIVGFERRDDRLITSLRYLEESQYFHVCRRREKERIHLFVDYPA